MLPEIGAVQKTTIAKERGKTVGERDSFLCGRTEILGGTMLVFHITRPTFDIVSVVSLSSCLACPALLCLL